MGAETEAVICKTITGLNDGGPKHGETMGADDFVPIRGELRFLTLKDGKYACLAYDHGHCEGVYRCRPIVKGINVVGR